MEKQRGRAQIFLENRVKSVAEMGDAASTFHMGSKKVALRKDIATTCERIAKACEVIVHEDIHKGNEAVGVLSGTWNV